MPCARCVSCTARVTGSLVSTPPESRWRRDAAAQGFDSVYATLSKRQSALVHKNQVEDLVTKDKQLHCSTAPGFRTVLQQWADLELVCSLLAPLNYGRMEHAPSWLRWPGSPESTSKVVFWAPMSHHKGQVGPCTHPLGQFVGIGSGMFVGSLGTHCGCASTLARCRTVNATQSSRSG